MLKLPLVGVAVLRKALFRHGRLQCFTAQSRSPRLSHRSPAVRLSGERRIYVWYTPPRVFWASLISFPRFALSHRILGEQGHVFVRDDCPRCPAHSSQPL